jgi:hypothetical protein
MGWIDQTGNLWLFGGEGVGGTTAGGQGYLNDMWRYSIANNQWTWAKGNSTINQPGVYGTQGITLATNMPGARTSGFTIRDAAGHVWLFGGKGHEGSANSGELGDLWMYNESSNDWTWIKGPALINQQAVYGTQTIAGASNRPGSRHDGKQFLALRWQRVSRRRQRRTPKRRMEIQQLLYQSHYNDCSEQQHGLLRERTGDPHRHWLR